MTGAGYSLTNSVNLRAYNVGLMNVKSTTQDYETGERKKVSGFGGVGQINIGKKSIKAPSIDHQAGASIVIPLFIYNKKVKE
ncbi:hypothetical protein [Acinetobacter indicus]|uniref:hypothetical protein n=1 Tax=Acinetobacter indicus TaxID=756892 RepID=UPI001D17AD92|nr:hypothetical protein [Acinetobacter indicus]